MNGIPPSPEECFEASLNRIIHAGDRVLDAGCGSGKYFQAKSVRQASCEIIGVDLAESVGANPALDSRVRARLESLPFRDNSFDVINCRLVIEHVRTPETVLTEFHRVLRRTGRLAIFTPNLLHYFGASARLTPHWFHLWFNRRVRGFDGADVFPTYYRANTRRRLRALLADAGFEHSEVTLVEGEPNVLAFNSLLHGMGRAYERAVRRFDSLAPFRLNIIAIAQKS